MESRIPLRVSNKKAYVWDVDGTVSCFMSPDIDVTSKTHPSLDIATIRSTHHICGILTGTLPHLSQQNVFLGVPLVLMPPPLPPPNLPAPLEQLPPLRSPPLPRLLLNHQLKPKLRQLKRPSLGNQKLLRRRPPLLLSVRRRRRFVSSNLESLPFTNTLHLSILSRPSLLPPLPRKLRLPRRKYLRRRPLPKPLPKLPRRLQHQGRR